MTTNEPDTVTVPVELLRRVQEDGVTSPATNELLALLPKPKPRLVAVDWIRIRDAWENSGIDQGKSYDALLAELAEQPDLLTLLEGAADSVFSDWSGYNFDIDVVVELKARIRTALGVTE